jgi:hypothetical protein
MSTPSIFDSTTGVYLPLIECEICRKNTRHFSVGRKYFLTIAKLIFRCKICGNDRVYGT